MLEVIALATKRLLIICLILSFVFSCVFLQGCGRSPEKKPPQNSNQQEASQKPKEPKEIKDITKDIETVLQEAEKKQEIAENPDQSQEQNKPGQEPTQSESGGGGGGQQGQQQGGKEGSQESKLQDWAGEEKLVESIHQRWNTLETKVVKAGAEDSLIGEFENNLDNLTTQVMEKSILGTQKATNELYGSMTKIAGLFQTDNPPPADMMKYYTQKSLLAIEEENWAEGKINAQDLKMQWEKVKTMLDKSKSELTTQMDYAIYDFEQSIDKRNKDVAIIKGEIILSNIEKIIEELKKNKEK